MSSNPRHDRPTGRRKPPRVVWDEYDKQDDCIRINQLHNPGGGVLVVHVPPRGTGSLYTAILDALGKRMRAPNFRAAKDPSVVVQWLRAERVRDIIFFGSHRIAESLDELIAVGPRPWFVTPSAASAARTQRRFNVKHLTRVSAMLKHLETLKEDPPPTVPRVFPCLPEQDFPLFLAVCHQRVRERSAFALVVEAFHIGFDEINRIFENDSAPRFEQLMVEIRTLLLATGSDRESICRLRGIQSALFWRGLALNVNLRRLLAVMHLDRQTEDLDALTQAVKATIDPVPSAIAAVAYATSLCPEEIAKLNKSHAPFDGSMVKFRGNQWPVPTGLRAPLAMCRDPYSDLGPKGNRRLFMKDGEPMTGEEIERQLWLFGLDTGCQVVSGRMVPSRDGDVPARLIDRHLDLVSLDGSNQLS